VSVLEVVSVSDREAEKHTDHGGGPEDEGSGLRRTVVSALIQAAAREALDLIIRVIGRGGPF